MYTIFRTDEAANLVDITATGIIKLRVASGVHHIEKKCSGDHEP